MVYLLSEFIIFQLVIEIGLFYCAVMPQQRHNTLFADIKLTLSYDVAPGSEITPCNKIDKPLVVYRFTGNVMTYITTLPLVYNFSVGD